MNQSSFAESHSSSKVGVSGEQYPRRRARSITRLIRWCTAQYVYRHMSPIIHRAVTVPRLARPGVKEPFYSTVGAALSYHDVHYPARCPCSMNRAAHRAIYAPLRLAGHVSSCWPTTAQFSEHGKRTGQCTLRPPRSHTNCAATI